MTEAIAERADFSALRYARCWEDTDVMLRALALKPGQRILSVASGGDNTLALLTTDPEQVVAVDISTSQLAMLELRWIAYRTLDYLEVLEFLGARDSERRLDLYERCRTHLSASAQQFWDQHPDAICLGVENSGRFERYLNLFGRRILPLIHSQSLRRQLLVPRPPAARAKFYAEQWNTWRWRLLFRIFFSRPVMERTGRARAFFDYVEEPIADKLLRRTRHALAELDPSQNPYLHWILLGHYGKVLPFALRPENYQSIRENSSRLHIQRQSVEDYINDQPAVRFDGFNLSNIFEYISFDSYVNLLSRLCSAANPSARLVYWNVFVERRRPATLAHELESLDDLADTLHSLAQTFFYDDLVIEVVRDSDS